VRRQLLPAELETMHPRQRDLMRVIYSSGGATLREVHAQIPDAPPSICGIRTLLSRLVRKGLLRVRPSGHHSELIYLPARGDELIHLGAFDRLVRDHFNGSKTRAFGALMRLAAEEKTAKRVH
jgi:predicted transcriptional regulator